VTQRRISVTVRTIKNDSVNKNKKRTRGSWYSIIFYVN
jgi:hypothetical protein